MLTGEEVMGANGEVALISGGEVMWTDFDWIKQNKLVLNISKTKSIILGSSHKLSSMPTLNLYLDGEPIQQVDKGHITGTNCSQSIVMGRAH